MTNTNARNVPASVDVVIVGAGFAGMYMLHKVRGLGMSAIVFEAGTGVGGTWFWNRYPGARVDIESVEYSYSFSDELQLEWDWSERYASQPELLTYANHVADRFDLRRDIRFETRVASAHFDETNNRWTISTDHGDKVSARYCVMATGCLSLPKEPDFAGIDGFQGETYHTSRWPHEGVDFSGKRVAIIGTGSSAIQSIPVIAEQAAHLTVFQRTPNFSVPANNAPMDPAIMADWKANRARYREEGKAAGYAVRQIDQQEALVLETPVEEVRSVLEERWTKRGGFSVLGGFADMGLVKEANDVGVAFVHDKIRSIVKDPATAELLCPKTYPIGTKRICVDTGYYATYNRPNVSLVDLHATPIETITPKGIKTSAAEPEFDAIVYAIGFDAMTGALNNIDIRGREGMALRDKWAEGPKTYLGLMVAGFPNLFTVTGPGSPSVLSNMLVSIEHHVEWIADCISYLADRQLGAIEATPDAETMWVAHVNEVADTTLYPQANSWYMGANVPGKPRVFMPYLGGFPVYTETCANVVANGYEGFALSSAAR